jgi:hypothetical protein
MRVDYASLCFVVKSILVLPDRNVNLERCPNHYRLANRRWIFRYGRRNVLLRHRLAGSAQAVGDAMLR